MFGRMIWLLLLVGFLGVNAYAFAAGTWEGLLSYLGNLGPWGTLATVDLLLALAIGLAWVTKDARSRGVSATPYIALTLLTGSVGILVYLARFWGRNPGRVQHVGSDFILTVSRDVPAPAAKVWEVLADFHNIGRFHPYVSSVDKLGEGKPGPGAQRRCNVQGMPSIEEKVETWEEGRGYSILASTPMDLFGTMRGHLSVRPDDDARSTATFSMQFSPKLGPVGRVFGQMMLSHLDATMVDGIIDGLVFHVRTGDKLSAQQARVQVARLSPSAQPVAS